MGFYRGSKSGFDLSASERAALRRLNPNAGVDAVSNSIRPEQSYELTLKSDGGKSVRGTLLTTENFPGYINQLARDMG